METLLHRALFLNPGSFPWNTKMRGSPVQHNFVHMVVHRQAARLTPNISSIPQLVEKALLALRARPTDKLTVKQEKSFQPQARGDGTYADGHGGQNTWVCAGHKPCPAGLVQLLGRCTKTGATKCSPQRRMVPAAIKSRRREAGWG